jgi:signal transduction histidine kinase
VDVVAQTFQSFQSPSIPAPLVSALGDSPAEERRPRRTVLPKPRSMSRPPIDFEFNMTPRILIVDDENGPRQSLRMLLKEDYDVSLATGVDDALRQLAVETVDIIITDIRMPHKTGMDLLREVREDNDDIEFIILTGYGELNTAMKAIEYGAFAYLEKPFDHRIMLEKVRACVEKRRREEDRKALECLTMEANRFETLGRLVSGTMHDLGTPLSVLGTHLELLSADPSQESLMKRLGTMESQVRHCTELVRSTMNFLRHSPDEQSPFDINTAVEVCLDVARPLLTRQQVSMRTNLSPDISICVGDFVLVRQAILNLIYNACQAMEAQPDPREITITTRCETSQLVLTIEDTGPGVPEKDRQRIFYTLFTTKGKKGTGLGLSVVKNVMHQHGGEVTLEPGVEGRGACFKLTFPYRR